MSGTGAGSAGCGPVRIAWAREDAATADIAVLDRLGARQRDRYERLDGLRARRFLVGRVLLAQLLAQLSPADVRLVAACATCGADDHGRLRTVSGTAAVSVSYGAGHVVAAAVAASAGRRVGIDVEADRAPGRMAELATLFAPRPAPTLAEWTAIEAVLKADGRGLVVPPDAVVLHDEPGAALPHGRLASVPGRPAALHVARAPGPAGAVVSVAIEPRSGSAR